MAEINCPWCYAPFTPVKRGVHIKAGLFNAHYFV